MKPNKPPAPIGLAVCFFLATVVTNGNAESETKPEIDTRMEKLEKLGKLPASQFSKIIDHSTSPNKRLAVAVGSKDGSKPVWHKTNHQGRADVSEFSFVLEGDGSSANYLINVQDDRVVGVLDGDYFGTRNKYNHASYTALWSPASRWFVEQQQWKWSTGPCTVHRMNAKGLPAGRIGLDSMAEKYVDEQLRKLSPELTAQERKGYAIRMNVSGITNDGEFTVEIEAEAPKKLEEKYVFLELSITAKVEESNNGALSIRVARVSIPTAKPEQNDR